MQQHMTPTLHQKKVTTICCVCGAHVSGPRTAAPASVSHGYCAFHFERAMQDVQKYLALQGRDLNGVCQAAAVV